MEIPTYVIFDADADKLDKNCSRAKHEKDNRALLTLLGKPEENPMPAETFSGPGFTMWHSDIGGIVEADIGQDELAAYRAKADQHYRHAGSLRKNSLHIGASLAFAWEAGKRPDSLVQVCDEILDPNNYV